MGADDIVDEDSNELSEEASEAERVRGTLGVDHVLDGLDMGARHLNVPESELGERSAMAEGKVPTTVRRGNEVTVDDEDLQLTSSKASISTCAMTVSPARHPRRAMASLTLLMHSALYASALRVYICCWGVQL